MKVTLHPKVYSKLLHLCRKFDTEVGAWGLAADVKDPLHITDCNLTLQTSTNAEIDWDSADIALFRRHCREQQKLEHDQYCHVALHTHPGYSADPSDVDWTHLKNTLMASLVTEYKTLKEAKRHPKAPWLVMVILAKEGKMTAHIMYYMDDPPIEAMLVSKIDIEVSHATEKEVNCWEAEYQAKVMKPTQKHTFPIHDPGGKHEKAMQIWRSRSGARLWNPDDEDWKGIEAELAREEEIAASKRGHGRKAKKKVPENTMIETTGSDSSGDTDTYSDVPTDRIEDAVEEAEEAEIVEINVDWDFLDDDTWQKRRQDLDYCKQVIYEGGSQFGITGPEDLEGCTPDEIREYANIIRTCLSSAKTPAPEGEPIEMGE